MIEAIPSLVYSSTYALNLLVSLLASVLLWLYKEGLLTRYYPLSLTYVYRLLRDLDLHNPVYSTPFRCFRLLQQKRKKTTQQHSTKTLPASSNILLSYTQVHYAAICIPRSKTAKPLVTQKALQQEEAAIITALSLFLSSAQYTLFKMSMVDSYQQGGGAYHPHRKALPPGAAVHLPPRSQSPLVSIDPNPQHAGRISQQPYTRPTNTNPISHQAYMNQYNPTARRTLSNATTSTSSTGNGPARANSTSSSQLQRSTSSRSGSSPNSYVALMRKQKATVWCDRAQVCQDFKLNSSTHD